MTTGPLLAQSSVTALDAIYRRRATRAFTPELVDEITVRELLRAATHAPTAMHREPWAFAIVQDATLLHQISTRAKQLAALQDPSFDIFHGARTLIVICTRSGDELAVADCWLAAENLMIAATAFGFGTCPIGIARAALADPEIRASLRIVAGIVPVAPIVVGISAGSAPQPTRHAPEILAWR